MCLRLKCGTIAQSSPYPTPFVVIPTPSSQNVSVFCDEVFGMNEGKGRVLSGL